ncbi:MAG: CopG family ribbon-helix-helix protein [Acidimicrobiia bacterium]
MSGTARINATMDSELLARLDAFAASRFEDRSTAIRQLVDFALRELAKRDALDAFRAGRLTLRELGRALGLDPWATTDLLAAEGVAAAQGDRSETRAALEALLPRAGQRRRR